MTSSSSCLEDPLSVFGLYRLQHENPDTWQTIIRKSLPPGPELRDDPTVAQALGAGLLDWAQLDRASPTTFDRHRRACAVATDVAGDLHVSKITDVALAEIKDKLVRRRCSAEATTRALTALRRLAVMSADALGVEPRFRSAPTPPAPRSEKPARRPLWSPVEVRDLLAVTTDVGARAAIGLAVGTGMRPREILRLHRGHVDLRGVKVGVLARDGQLLRVHPLPPWTRDLLGMHLRSPGPTGISNWVFRSPRDASRPRTDFAWFLQEAQRRAGHHIESPVTLTALRRTYVWWAIHAGLPREAVRGTWRVGPDGAPPWWSQLQRAARSWNTLTGLNEEVYPDGGGEVIATAEGLLPITIVEAKCRAKSAPPLPESVAA